MEEMRQEHEDKIRAMEGRIAGLQGDLEELMSKLVEAKSDNKSLQNLITLGDTMHRGVLSHTEWIQSRELQSAQHAALQAYAQASIARWNMKATGYKWRAWAGLHVFSSTRWRNQARSYWLSKISALAGVKIKDQEIKMLAQSHQTELTRQARLRREAEAELNKQMLALTAELDDTRYKLEDYKCKVRELSTRLASGCKYTWVLL